MSIREFPTSDQNTKASEESYLTEATDWRINTILFQFLLNLSASVFSRDDDGIPLRERADNYQWKYGNKKLIYIAIIYNFICHN
jgi:hypothetical protein